MIGVTDVTVQVGPGLSRTQVQSTSKLDQFLSSYGLGREVCRVVVS